MLRVVHAQDVHNHLVHHLYLAIDLGGNVMELLRFVSNNDERLDQNLLRNLLSQSEIMERGIQKCTYTHSKKILVVSSATILFLQAARMAILENILMTMKVYSWPCLVEGNPDM